MNQSEIVAEMKVLPEIDVDYEVGRRVDFIKYQLELSNQKTLVLGISGGIDSCTCGRLAQLAVDNKEFADLVEPFEILVDGSDLLFCDRSSLVRPGQIVHADP